MRLPSLAAAAVATLALSSVACAPMKAAGTLKVETVASPADAPETAKTVHVEYALRNDLLQKTFTKSLKDGFRKRGGLKVEETLAAKAHFDVQNARVLGDVTYVKNRFGGVSIVEAKLRTEAHYDASLSVEIDVKAQGDKKLAKDGDWDATLAGGKPFELQKSFMSTNIPVVAGLFVNVHFELSAACNLEEMGAVHATAGVGVGGDIGMEAAYKKAGWDDEPKKKFQFKADRPSFQVSPKPYLTLAGRQTLHGRCSVQPTAVLLLEHAVGAKLTVEPYVDFTLGDSSVGKAGRDVHAGIAVNAATDIEIFGRRIHRGKDRALFDVAIGDKPAPSPAAPNAPSPSDAPRLPAAPTFPVPAVNAASEPVATKALSAARTLLASR